MITTRKVGSVKAARRLIGVLGGMGPLATLDFMHKVIGATGAQRDQDHVPLLIHCVPQIPDRIEAISAGTDEPFPALLSALRLLERAGAELIVIPCNTAHAWFDRLAASTNVPMLHIAEAVRTFLGSQRIDSGSEIALMATLGTVRAGFYQRYLMSSHSNITTPPATTQKQINEAIIAVKAGDMVRGRELATNAARALLNSGTNRLLLACTELPIAIQGTDLEPHCIDASACLAEACVAFSLGQGRLNPRDCL